MWERFFKIGGYQVWVREDEGPVYQATRFFGENLEMVQRPESSPGYRRLSSLLALKDL